jgi:hypothetical protein
MRKPLAALLLSTATVAALAVPAGAAVPNRPASATIPCNDGSGKSARIWHRPGQLAAKNPCRRWLELDYGGQSYNGAFDDAYVLAPGAHFNWGGKRAVHLAGGGRLVDGPFCTGNEPAYQQIYSYKDVRPADNC